MEVVVNLPRVAASIGQGFLRRADRYGSRVSCDMRGCPGSRTGRVTGLRDSACCSPSRLPLQGVHVGRGEAVAGDAPVTAVDLLDEDPGDRPEVLALDFDHRVRDLPDHLLLLLGSEDSLDQLDRDHRHLSSPFIIDARPADDSARPCLNTDVQISDVKISGVRRVFGTVCSRQMTGRTLDDVAGTVDMLFAYRVSVPVKDRRPLISRQLPERTWLTGGRRGSGPAGVRPRRVQSGSVRGSPKMRSALLSMNPVIALIWLPARVSTMIPLACATGACGSRT